MNGLRLYLLFVLCAAVCFDGWGESGTASAFMQGGGAVLEVPFCSAGSLEKDAVIFSDRDYTFLELPDGLKGKLFLAASIGGNFPVRVVEEGLLTVITPLPDASCSQVAELEALGFTWIQAPAVFQCFGSQSINRCRIYQKQVKNGDSFLFRKWVIYAGFDSAKQVLDDFPERVRRVSKALAQGDTRQYATDILVNRPDYVVFIPKQPREKAKHVPSKTGDNYNDHFQVIEHNGTLFAFWTQASRESDIDQHIAFSKSLDKGNTWTEPEIIAGSPNKKNPSLRASWQQPMISKSGRIYVLWNQQVSSARPSRGNMFGIYSDDGGEIWSAPKMVPMKRMSRDPEDPLIPPSWCNWQRPLRLGKDGRFLVGVSRHGKLPGEKRYSCTVEFLQFNNIDVDPEVEDIRLSWFSTNENVLQVKHEKFGSACEEAGIVKLPDGRLFALMRTNAGRPFWSQSRDDGITWSQPRELLNRDGGTPYLHPRSPCPIYDWKGPEAASGYYFALVHDTFDFDAQSVFQNRGPLYLIAGRFNPDAEQPIEFAESKLFAPRPGQNSFYTSYTIVDGKGILWFPDKKFYLLGREIGDEWFQ